MFQSKEYAFIKRKEVSLKYKEKKKFYLDTKFWIDFCDVKLGKKKDKEIDEIYSLLKRGVETGQFICPISQRIYIEILNQTDIESLNKSAEIIDELSLNTCIVSEYELLKTELEYFFLRSLDKKEYDPSSYGIWDSVINILGFIEPPYIQTLDEKTNAWIQKNYIDEIYTKSFSDIANKLGTSSHKHAYNLNYFNENKKTYIKDYKTLKELYLIEVKGTIDAYRDIIIEKSSELIKKRALAIGIPVEDSNQEELTKILNIIYFAFENGRIKKDFSFLDVYAMMHAKLRWNTTQKYKNNDFNDMAHAAYALPYFDCFFTENSLHNMIKESKYDLKYNCNVASKKDEILNILKGI